MYRYIIITTQISAATQPKQLQSRMTMMKDPPAETALPYKPLVGASLVDKNVASPYGMGIVLEFRETDQVYVIKLTQENSYSPLAILYTQDSPARIETQQDQVDKLNVAYEALEKMRRMNLEMECFEAGVAVNFEHCATCLFTKSEERSRFPRLQKFVDDAGSTESNSFPRIRSLWGSNAASKSDDLDAASTESNSFPRIRSLWRSNAASKSEKPAQKTVVLPRIQKFMDERQKSSASPCLICASISCSAHSSKTFRKEGITLCLSCERLFELNFIVDCVSTPDAAERAKHIDHMIDCYDRCLLLLMYSTQYVEKIAQSLGQQKEQQNKIGLGSSGVGVVSGVLGIAAAATILTPAGPPLLLASIFFGGGATAVQSGTEAYNYFSEPNKLADRMIALHGMVLSILRVTSTLRDAMLRDHIRTDVFEAEATTLPDQVQERLEKNRTSVLAGANFGRTMTLGGVASVEAGAVAGVEVGAVAGARGATAFSRAGTAAARTIRFARFAGGALSAAVLVMEANAIKSTLRSMHEGSPCDKAQKIREIAKESNSDELPTTSELDEECQAYLTALASRPMPSQEVAAEAMDAQADEFPEAECKVAPEIDEMSAAGAVIVDGDAVGVATMPAEAQGRSTGGSSLLERIQMHKQNRQQSDRVDEVVAVVVEDNRTRDSELSLIV
jgi:hypothetical protein